MYRNIYKTLVIGLVLLSPLSYLPAQQISNDIKILKQEFNLVPPHSKDIQYFDMVSKLQQHAPDGTPLGWDVYHLSLRCVPSADPSVGDEYTCLKFSVKMHDSAEVLIPSLTNWKYRFKLTASAKDSQGQVFGIDHSKFENITDENGKRLPIANTYAVYNAFIDFHSMSVFADRSAAGNGAQNLHRIGDKVIHSASFSQPPVNLGSQIAEGSYFKNGEITLAFKGLGLVNQKACAILGYDSGESSFYMLMKPMANMEITTKGSSHYWGDIYKDLSSGWIQKATLHEMVVSQTTIPGMTSKTNSVVERSIVIKNVKVKK
jgi:hypothetical protein